MHNDPVIKSYEQLRYKVIFHEFAHLIMNYNDPEKLKISIIPNIQILNMKDKDNANKMVNDFLKTKGILDWKENDENAV